MVDQLLLRSTASGIINIDRVGKTVKSWVKRLASRLNGWSASYAGVIISINQEWDHHHQPRMNRSSSIESVIVSTTASQIIIFSCKLDHQHQPWMNRSSSNPIGWSASNTSGSSASSAGKAISIIVSEPIIINREWDHQHRGSVVDRLLTRMVSSGMRWNRSASTTVLKINIHRK